MRNFQKNTCPCLFACMVQFSLVGSAHAEPVGAYKYIEKGFDGKMEIKEVSACEIKSGPGCLGSYVLILQLYSSNKATTNDCDVEAVETPAARIASGSSLETLFQVKADGGEASKSFSVKFDRTGATITYEGDPLDGLCGMGDDFLGRWRKAR